MLRGSDNNKLGSFANSEEVYKENTMKPQPWNHGFTKKQHRTPAPPPVQWVPSTPTFQGLFFYLLFSLSHEWFLQESCHVPLRVSTNPYQQVIKQISPKIKFKKSPAELVNVCNHLV